MAGVWKIRLSVRPNEFQNRSDIIGVLIFLFAAIGYLLVGAFVVKLNEEYEIAFYIFIVLFILNFLYLMVSLLIVRFAINGRPLDARSANNSLLGGVDDLNIYQLLNMPKYLALNISILCILGAGYSFAANYDILEVESHPGEDEISIGGIFWVTDTIARLVLGFIGFAFQ